MSLPRVKPWILALIALVLTVGSFAAASTLRPRGRDYSQRQQTRRAHAAKICESQGRRCHVLERPDQPRDLTGASCVCD